jgi:hypothetical protein
MLKGVRAPPPLSPVGGFVKIKSQPLIGGFFHAPKYPPAPSHKLADFLSKKIVNLWYCYITVNSATTALQNGACTYRCISKQMHYKTPFSHMKNLEIYENYITLFCLEKINFFIILY